MKLCGIIVAYYPVYSVLKINIQSIINDVDKLILWDNTPDNRLLKEMVKEFGDKLIYMTDGENIGIAAGLNKGVNWIINNKYTHLLTLDQDSSFSIDHLLQYKNLILREEQSNIGAYGTNLFFDNNFIYDHQIKQLVVPRIITSGSIFPVNTFLECGLFNEALFIDSVDYEFCYRIFKLKNLKCLIFTDITLNHEFGYKQKSRFGFSSDNYSAIRIYYIIRNHIMTWKAYPKLFDNELKIGLIKGHIFLRIPKIVLAEQDKLNKLNSLFKGVIHGLFKKNLINVEEKDLYNNSQL